MKVDSRLTEVDALSGDFPDVPPEAIFKEDLLRIGVAFSEDALRAASGFKPKSYFIFSFDRRPISELSQAENLRAPEEMILSGGARGFRPTVVNVRINPQSPYLVEIQEGRLVLSVEGTSVVDVRFQDIPSYYNRRLSNGKTIQEIAPTIEWGYLVYLTVYRKCQYFGFKEECTFCDINENVRQQKAAGRPYSTVKQVEEILEALTIIDEEDVEKHSRAYTITGGSITRHLRGQDEVEFYYRYARAINERFGGRWISKLVIQAHPKERLRIFKDVADSCLVLGAPLALLTPGRRGGHQDRRCEGYDSRASIHRTISLN